MRDNRRTLAHEASGQVVRTMWFGYKETGNATMLDQELG